MTYRQSKSRMGLIIIICVLTAFIFIRIKLGIVVIPIAILVILGQLVAYASNKLIINNDEVTLRLGIVRERTTEIPFNKINTIAVKRGIFGRMLDYGNLVIYTGNDTSGIKFIGIDKPAEVKQQLKG